MVDNRLRGDGMLERFKYTDTEKKKLVDSMIILVDTREKKNDHITKYFDEHGILYEKKAMEFGDYSFYIPANEELSIPRPIYFENDIIVERKASLEELSANFTTGRTRFEKEFAASKAEKKYLLIENAEYGDLISGNYNTDYNKRAYWASLHSFNHKYNLEVFFIANEYSAIYILGVFQYYLKNLIK